MELPQFYDRKRAITTKNSSYFNSRLQTEAGDTNLRTETYWDLSFKEELPSIQIKKELSDYNDKTRTLN